MLIFKERRGEKTLVVGTNQLFLGSELTNPLQQPKPINSEGERERVHPLTCESFGSARKIQILGPLNY